MSENVSNVTALPRPSFVSRIAGSRVTKLALVAGAVTAAVLVAKAKLDSEDNDDQSVNV